MTYFGIPSGMNTISTGTASWTYHTTGTGITYTTPSSGTTTDFDGYSDYGSRPIASYTYTSHNSYEADQLLAAQKKLAAKDKSVKKTKRKLRRQKEAVRSLMESLKAEKALSASKDADNCKLQADILTLQNESELLKKFVRTLLDDRYEGQDTQGR